MAADLLGPLPNGQNVFVVVDYYSRYFEVRLLKSVTSTKLIQSLEDVFASHGLPLSLKTDNAQCFLSQEFKNFLLHRDIQHKTSIPLWPQSNGEVERQNRTLLKFLKITHAKGQDLKTQLNKFSFAYQMTPYCTTGRSPAELLYRRKIRGILPEFVPTDEALSDHSPEVEMEVEAAEQDKANKGKVAQYVDKKRNAKSSDIQEGDTVLLQQPRQNKLTTTYKPELYTVTSRNGSEVTVQSPDGVEYRRNVAHVKKYVSSPGDRGTLSESADLHDSSELVQKCEPQNSEPTSQQTRTSTVVAPQEHSSVAARRSTLVREKPRYLENYIRHVISDSV